MRPLRLAVLASLVMASAAQADADDKHERRLQAELAKRAQCAACESEKADMDRKCSGNVPAFRNAESRCPKWQSEWQAKCGGVVSGCTFRMIDGVFR
jgi:hypothetical protein